MPTAPAGAGETEPRQLPESNERQKRREYMGLISEKPFEKERIRRLLKQGLWWLCCCCKCTGMQQTDHTTNDGFYNENSRNKQTNK